MRRLLAVITLVLSGTLTTACMQPFADVCPAIGYVTGLQVDATGITDATWVQLCADEACSPLPGETESTDIRIGVNEDDGIWAFSFLSIEMPDDVTIRATDADGAVLQESEHHIDWAHSTERCGGPSTAEPIVLVP
ncbi:hypothetical protein QF046_003589 [Microbacterium sp. W4I4]|uniref:hypothetical protein n=1 Tax=Microbacterium sp. W4I4 TaxID=3042295 RepID=UPI00278319B8|nr:hypothetical protein [Microbacterium sp. W4I4]MDQ0615948.1 hypothetical protein [Microbacterium sp. W4I4]